MGEEIEIRDVNGNLVLVSLYPTLARLGRDLVDGETKGVHRADGRRVELRLEPIDVTHDEASV